MQNGNQIRTWLTVHSEVKGGNDIRVFTHYGDLIWMSQWQFFLYSLGTKNK
jgi:hypothetical protein